MNSKLSSSELVRFYLGEMAHPDLGATIDDLWSWSDDRLLRFHNWCNWLFPTYYPSESLYRVTISDSEVDLFRNDPELRRRYVKSLERILILFGLELTLNEGAVRVTRSEHFEQKRGNWLSPKNPSLQRVSRILQSTYILGFEPVTAALLSILQDIRADLIKTRVYDVITDTTLHYWQHSAKGHSE